VQLQRIERFLGQIFLPELVGYVAMSDFRLFELAEIPENGYHFNG